MNSQLELSQEVHQVLLGRRPVCTRTSQQQKPGAATPPTARESIFSKRGASCTIAARQATGRAQVPFSARGGPCAGNEGAAGARGGTAVPHATAETRGMAKASVAARVRVADARARRCGQDRALPAPLVGPARAPTDAALAGRQFGRAHHCRSARKAAAAYLSSASLRAALRAVCAPLAAGRRHPTHMMPRH